MMSKNKSLSQSKETKEKALASSKRNTLLMNKKASPSRAASRSGSNKASPTVANQDGSPVDRPDLHARVADRAHEIFTHRGGHHGMDLEDWFEAERQVLEEGC
jgi:Protein of unknown function (DUF2934)